MPHKASGRRVERRCWSPQASINALLQEARREYPRDAFYAAILGATAEGYLTKVERSGWLRGMPEQVQARIRKRVKHAFSGERDKRFDAMCSLSSFGVEFNDFGESYRDVLKTISRASWGVFAPRRVTEEEVGGKLRLSFHLNGKKYSRLLAGHRVADLNVFWLVNRALRECSGQDRLVCILPRGITQDDWVEHTFVAPAVFKRAIALGVLPAAKVSSQFYEEVVDFPDVLDFDD